MDDKLENKEQKTMDTSSVIGKEKYDSGKKDSKGDMLIDTTERVEVTAIKDFGAVKKGDKIKVHPTMKVRLKNKKLI